MEAGAGRSCLEPSMNFLKCKNWILPLILLLCARAFCTTAVFIITPKRIVAGTDRMANNLNLSGKLSNAGTASKIVLLKGRFIVACIGLEKMRAGPPDKQIVTYNFPSWVRGIESQISSNTSVLMLVNMVERESAKTFRQTVPIEAMMRTGALKHAQAIDKFLVQFVVSGFDHGVVTLIEVNYELDWQKNLLIGPNRVVSLPNDGIDIALYLNGLREAIDTDKLRDPNSYAHKRMEALVPTAFKKILASQPTGRIEAVRAVRALITIEAEVEPRTVGSGAAVVILPSIGEGAVMEYQNSLTLPRTKRLKEQKNSTQKTTRYLRDGQECRLPGYTECFACSSRCRRRSSQPSADLHSVTLA